jgi:hypothetical protein
VMSSTRRAAATSGSMCREDRGSGAAAARDGWSPGAAPPDRIFSEGGGVEYTLEGYGYVQSGVIRAALSRAALPAELRVHVDALLDHSMARTRTTSRAKRSMTCSCSCCEAPGWSSRRTRCPLRS